MADRTYRITRDGAPYGDYHSTGSPVLALARVVDMELGTPEHGFQGSMTLHASARYATATATIYGAQGAGVTTFTATLVDRAPAEQSPAANRTLGQMQSAGGSEALVVQYLNALGIQNGDVAQAFLAMTAVMGRKVTPEEPLTPQEAEDAIPALKRTLAMAEKGLDWMDFYAFVRQQGLFLVTREEHESAYRAWRTAVREG